MMATIEDRGQTDRVTVNANDCSTFLTVALCNS